MRDVELGLRLIKARQPSYTEILEAELAYWREQNAKLIIQNTELKAQLHREQLEFHFK